MIPRELTEQYSRSDIISLAVNPGLQAVVERVQVPVDRRITSLRHSFGYAYTDLVHEAYARRNLVRSSVSESRHGEIVDAELGLRYWELNAKQAAISWTVDTGNKDELTERLAAGTNLIANTGRFPIPRADGVNIYGLFSQVDDHVNVLREKGELGDGNQPEIIDELTEYFDPDHYAVFNQPFKPYALLNFGYTTFRGEIICRAAERELIATGHVLKLAEFDNVVATEQLADHLDKIRDRSVVMQRRPRLEALTDTATLVMSNVLHDTAPNTFGNLKIYVDKQHTDRRGVFSSDVQAAAEVIAKVLSTDPDIPSDVRTEMRQTNFRQPRSIARAFDLLVLGLQQGMFRKDPESPVAIASNLDRVKAAMRVVSGLNAIGFEARALRQPETIGEFVVSQIDKGRSPEQVARSLNRRR